MTIPIGPEYLQGLLAYEDQRPREHFSEESQEFLGTALSCLYHVATCNPACRNGDHILENIAGRSYNLIAAGIQLCRMGYYDESLSLVRSLGEIGNLLAMLLQDPPLYQQWVTAKPSERKGNGRFSPGGIRKAVTARGQVPLAVNSAEYAELCEKVTHITPETVPNVHNAKDQKHVGGIHQPEGFEKTTGSLEYMAMMIAMMVTRMVNRTDLTDTLLKLTVKLEPPAA